MPHETLNTQSSTVVEATAPGKSILLGEHAVVYDRPAIAMPVTHVRATAVITSGRPNVGAVIHAEDLGRQYLLDAAPKGDPLSFTVRTTLDYLDVATMPDIQLRVRSTIPIASGLGSGAAVATAIVRAVAAYLGRTLSDAEVSELVYETETLLHGTPSGIDNTVVAYEAPIWFQRNEPPVPLVVPSSFTFLIADTGISSPTKKTVGDVRAGREADREHYEALFDLIASLVVAGRRALEAGDALELGRVMVKNQEALRNLDVSSTEIEQLVTTALDAGALGAKLSGAGRGGNVLILTNPEQCAVVETALYRSGAVGVFRTVLSPRESHAE